MTIPTLLRRASAAALILSLPSLALAQGSAPGSAPGAAPAQPAAAAPGPDTVVAKVNGQPITGADLSLAAEDPALSLPGVDEAAKQNLLVDYMVDLKVGAQAAEAAKVGDSPEFKRKLAYFRDKLLLDDYLERETKKSVTPEAAKALYDQTVKSMKPEEEVRARHILVPTEAEARTALAEARAAGADFAEVARRRSTGPGSREGGDLGFFKRGDMIPEFATAAFGMQPGQISESPVRTQFGWHVIKVEVRRAVPPPPFEEAQEALRQRAFEEAVTAEVERIRGAARIERFAMDGSPLPAPAAPSLLDGAAPPAAPQRR